jgi:hypothetical protein
MLSTRYTAFLCDMGVGSFVLVAASLTFSHHTHIQRAQEMLPAPRVLAHSIYFASHQNTASLLLLYYDIYRVLLNVLLLSNLRTTCLLLSKYLLFRLSDQCDFTLRNQYKITLIVWTE